MVMVERLFYKPETAPPDFELEQGRVFDTISGAVGEACYHLRRHPDIFFWYERRDEKDLDSSSIAYDLRMNKLVPEFPDEIHEIAAQFIPRFADPFESYKYGKSILNSIEGYLTYRYTWGGPRWKAIKQGAQWSYEFGNNDEWHNLSVQKQLSLYIRTDKVIRVCYKRAASSIKK